MVQGFMLFGLGVVAGRWWARTVFAAPMSQCPKCSVENEQRRTIVEISSIARAGEAHMRHIAETPQKDISSDTSKGGGQG